MTNLVFFKLASGLYFAGAVLFLPALWQRRDRFVAVATATTAIGCLLHTGALTARLVQTGHVPLTNLPEVMAFFSWLLILAFLALMYGSRLPLLGMLVLPLAFMTLYPAARLLEESPPLNPTLQGIWLGIHASLSLLGVAALTVAGLAGMLYLIEERLLKTKRLIALSESLPSLGFLDDLNRLTVSLGFALLTLGMLTGAIWAADAWGSFWALNPKLNATFMTWVFYLVMLYGRASRGWRAKKAAYLAVIGLVGVFLTFTGVSLFLKGLHVFT